MRLLLLITTVLFLLACNESNPESTPPDTTDAVLNDTINELLPEQQKVVDSLRTHYYKGKGIR